MGRLAAPKRSSQAKANRCRLAFSLAEQHAAGIDRAAAVTHGLGVGVGRGRLDQAGLITPLDYIDLVLGIIKLLVHIVQQRLQ